MLLRVRPRGRELTNSELVRPVVQSVRALGDYLHRGEPWEIKLPDKFMKKVDHTYVWSNEVDPGVRMFFKMYRHRHLTTWLKSKATRFRAEREYDRLCILHQAGVPCSEPLVFAYGTSPEHGRYEVLGTREIPYARKMAIYLRSAEDSGEQVDLSLLFQTIRQMHAAGVYHGTLTPYNILVSEPPDGPNSFYVIDLPRAVDFARDLLGTKMAWYDLIHFTYRTSAYIGLDACLPLLELYDFTDEDKQRFKAQLAHYRTSKLRRFHRRNKLNLKAWWEKRRHQGERPPNRQALRQGGDSREDG